MLRKIKRLNSTPSQVFVAVRERLRRAIELHLNQENRKLLQFASISVYNITNVGNVPQNNNFE